MLTIKETAEKIKQYGPDKVRKIPAADGKVDIQINDGSGWVTAMSSISVMMADDIIRQASNKVMLG